MRIQQLIAAAVTPMVLTLLIPFGINETTPVGEAITLLVTGIGTAALVWYTSKK